MFQSAILSAAAFLFFSFGAHAGAVNLTCTTDPELTTSFAISTQGTVTTIEVVHHNGTEYMPVSSVTLTPHDLPPLIEKIKILASLGSSYSLKVDASKCTQNSSRLIDCYGPLNQNIGGHKLSWYYLYSSSVHTATALADPSQTTRLDMDLVIDGKDYDFAMDYDPSGCVDTTIGRILSASESTRLARFARSRIETK